MLRGLAAFRSSATASSPTGSLYFDVPLAGFSFFSFVGAFVLSPADYIAFAFSDDSGASFVHQASPADGYATLIKGSSLSPELTIATRSLGLLTGVSSVFAQVVSCQIFAGTAKLTANLRALATSDPLDEDDPQTAEIEAALSARDISDIFGSLPVAAFGYLSLGGHAIVGRENLLRILPLGNGDLPPTSGHTLRGVWSLYGNT